LLVVVDVGTRTLAMAQRVVHQVTRVLAPGCVPLFLTDGFKEYRTAVLAHCGQWMHPERRQDQGPLPKPRWVPLPALRYAQVVQSYRRQRLVGVTHRVGFGTPLAIEEVLARCGWTIKTAFVERLNLDIRQGVAAIGRRVNTLCQGKAGLLDQLVLFQAYHNFVLPHASLRRRSCTWTLRVNISDFPFDCYRDKKVWTRGLLWPSSGLLPPGDGRDASRADTRRPLSPPPLTASHHRSVLTSLLVEATAGRERAAP